MMKAPVSTPSSSVKSSTTVDSETRDSCYFPGCRKDANCKCEICVASINATLDLMPKSTQRNSTAKTRGLRRSPVLFNPSVFSTPKSSMNPSATVSPPSNSSASTGFLNGVKIEEKKEFGFGAVILRFLVGLSLVFVMEFGVSSVVSGVFEPEFPLDVVRNLSEKSWVSNNLTERLIFLRNEIDKLVDDEVSNCSSFNSLWKVNQDGLLLNSRCTLYESITEEVSIWGWPLQTAGLLTAGYSSRSFTLLSGRLTEWANGETSYRVMNVNSSWTQRKWSSSAVHLDPNTWILEYTQSPIRENAKFVSAVVEFLKFRFIREFEMLKKEFWLLSSFKSQQSLLRGERSYHVPT